MAYCVSCGNEMESEWNNCPSCGATKKSEVNVVPTPIFVQESTSMGIQQPPQDGLIIGAYILAVISLFLLPICFGPLAIILSAIASSRGDKRGTAALIVSILLMILGMIFGMLVAVATW